MIEKLDPEDSQSYRAETQLAKLNELIEVVNGTYLPATLEVTDGEPYCSQAEEALKQVAVLEHNFETHYHTSLDTKYNTTGPKPGGLVEFDNPHND
jgi:hypothetical protein